VDPPFVARGPTRGVRNLALAPVPSTVRRLTVDGPFGARDQTSTADTARPLISSSPVAMSTLPWIATTAVL